MPSLRRNHPRYHRMAGRVLVPAGIAAGLSGMWVAVFSDLPVCDNTPLIWLRLLFGSLMVAGLVLGPITVVAGQPGGNLKAAGMGFAWVLNLAVAEWLVRRSQSPRRV